MGDVEPTTPEPATPEPESPVHQPPVHRGMPVVLVIETTGRYSGLPEAAVARITLDGET